MNDEYEYEEYYIINPNTRESLNSYSLNNNFRNKLLLARENYNKLLLDSYILDAHSIIINILEDTLFSFDRIETLNADLLLLGMYVYNGYKEDNSEYELNKERLKKLKKIENRNIIFILKYVRLINQYYYNYNNLYKYDNLE